MKPKSIPLSNIYIHWQRINGVAHWQISGEVYLSHQAHPQ
jgi:hypothetical protein